MVSGIAGIQAAIGCSSRRGNFTNQFRPTLTNACLPLTPSPIATAVNGEMTHSRLVFPNPNTFSLDAIAI